MPPDAQSHASAPASPAPIRVLCVDDYLKLTEVLRSFIDAQPDMRCVGCLTSAGDLAESVRRVCTPTPANPPDAATPLVVILDASMPGKDPFEAASELAAAFPEVKTIFYSGHNDREIIERVKSVGARGFVTKGGDPTIVLQAVREVAAGRVVIPGVGRTSVPPGATPR